MEEIPTILIVDNHAMFRHNLSDWLQIELRPCQVYDVENGEQALAEVIKNPPDVAIVDLSLPDMDGMDVTRKIKAQNPKTVVVAISLHQEKDYRNAALQAGATDHINKFDLPSRLVPILRNCLQLESIKPT